MNDILRAYRDGELTETQAEHALEQKVSEARLSKDLGHTLLDMDRQRRTGQPEVIYGLHKSITQIQDIITALTAEPHNILITRLDQNKFAQLALPNAEHWQYSTTAGLLSYAPNSVTPVTTTIAVVSAGTSDAPVAEEAALTCEFFGNPVKRINDVGVAGLHRLLNRLDEIRTAQVVIVVAGMEGALTSVMGGLVSKPVIAVPTSVGYGAAFEGVTTLLAMLTSCAAGVSVVNIDNGFGAGLAAHRINQINA